MKVMCIDDTHWRGTFGGPHCGEVVTVIGDRINMQGIPAYEFLEYPPPPGCLYRIFSKKYFSPLSDIDESELVKEKELVES